MSSQEWTLVSIGTACTAMGVCLGLSSAASIWDHYAVRTFARECETWVRLGLSPKWLQYGLRGWGLAMLCCGWLLWFVWAMPPVALVATWFVYISPNYLLKAILQRRKNLLRDQLVGATHALVSHTQAGTAPSKGLRAVARDTPQPLSGHLHRIVADYCGGRRLEDAIQSVQDRLGLEAFTLFAAAVKATLRRGGRLDEALSRIAASLRENQRLERKMASDTASGQRVVVMLALFPPLFLFLMHRMAADEVELLFTTFEGQLVLTAAMLFEYAGIKLALRMFQLEPEELVDAGDDRFAAAGGLFQYRDTNWNEAAMTENLNAHLPPSQAAWLVAGAALTAAAVALFTRRFLAIAFRPLPGTSQAWQVDERRLAAVRQRCWPFRCFEPLIRELRPFVAVLPLLGSQWLQSRVNRAQQRAYATARMTSEEFLAYALFVGLLTGAIALPLLVDFCGWIVAGELTLGVVTGVVLVIVRQIETQAARRMRQIKRRLPFGVDMLALLVDAGATPLEGLATTVEENRGSALGEELATVLRHTRGNRSLVESLRYLGHRLEDPEIDEMVMTISNAQQHGTPLSGVLLELAEQIRVRRGQQLEKQAGQAQAMMVFPGFVVMVACLLVMVAPFVLAGMYNPAL